MFSNASDPQPSLTFTSYTGDGVPVSCAVYLTVIYGEESQVQCTATVTVNQCIRDCFGVINGSAVYDECGVCDGDGSSCDCEDIVINGEISTLSVDFGTQCKNATKLTKKYARTDCARRYGRRELLQLQRKTASLCKSGTATIESIPTYINNCNHEECVLCDNLLKINSIKKLSGQLYKLSRKAISLYNKCQKGDGVCRRSVSDCRKSARDREAVKRLDQKSSRKAYNLSKNSIKNIPSSTYSCTPAS